jgi:hypothetical protein
VNVTAASVALMFIVIEGHLFGTATALTSNLFEISLAFLSFTSKSEILGNFSRSWF